MVYGKESAQDDTHGTVTFLIRKFGGGYATS